MNDEVASVHQVFDNNIIVEYKGKFYERPKSIIGSKLFIMDGDKTKPKCNLTNQRDKDKETAIAKNKPSCSDCMVNRKGDFDSTKTPENLAN